MKRIFVFVIFALILHSLASQAPKGGKDQEKTLNYIFEGGSEGYKCFRIPAVITTKKGALLAFAEGRKNGCSDTGSIDLVMKRSTDGGKTWGKLEVLWHDEGNTCGNPSPVVDRTTGHIFLLSTWNLGEDHESEIIAQKSKDTRRVFVLKSENEGESWSVPKEITSDVKLPNWTWYATGPGSGIQILGGRYKDRLVIASDHIEAVTKKYYSHTIYSDDNGETWELGGSTPLDQVNECEVVELSDHRLMLNMRNYDRQMSSRQLAYSDDGGESWKDMHHHESLIEPICQASTLRFDYKGQVYVLFANPADTKNRVNMTIRGSSDDGKSWPMVKQFFPGASAYSDLTPIDRKNIGILYEGGYKSAYQGIIWESVSIKELLGM
ncbi:exo-alpha-sialidase [Arenibacter sp. BSSL-BM3]|uniref:exo-alpha-sialidase n=1 Tax=Arenibacter arenosicollis TaxID=2762274 RepID=A0ABR7QH43_9FLAO|nr:sialidase family protein [Arenibacter arenosicollis]MBC8766424.1 exo-alpha-sialidase [Arenibacter arenosicollis]